MHPSPSKPLGPVTIRRRWAPRRNNALTRTQPHRVPRRDRRPHTQTSDPSLCSPLRGHRKHTAKPQKVAHSCSEEPLAVATLAAASSLEGAADCVEELCGAALRGERRSSAAGCSECALCALLEVPSQLFQRASAASTAVFLSDAAFAVRCAFVTPAAARPPWSSQKAGGRPPPRAPPWPPFFSTFAPLAQEQQKHEPVGRRPRPMRRPRVVRFWLSGERDLIFSKNGPLPQNFSSPAARW